MKNKSNIFYTSPQTLASLSQDTSVLLAFSGGADSSALLHLLKEDSQNKGYKLYAAHFNHQIRGDEAERDAAFCKNTCELLDIPFFIGSADVPSLANKNGNSIEAEARECRYAFFEQVMQENNIPILVTAHHAEDQVESIMLHILRGSGIAGLSGIAECRTFADKFYLVRPFLKTKKEDILFFCAENNINFVTDSTNFDTDYTRNFIRAELTPKMSKLQPNLTQVFERLSNCASSADDFILASAKEFIENEGYNEISLDKLNTLHPALKSRVLSIAFEKYSDKSSLEYIHIQSIIKLSQKAEPHSSISLPNKKMAKIENNHLVFAKDCKTHKADEFDVPFTVGKTELPNGIIINIEKNPIKTPTDNDIFLDVKCDIIKNDSHFRSKKEGDVIFYGKMNKKIKKLISEKKISLDMRNKLPLLVCENDVLWVPSVAVCDCIKKDTPKFQDDFFRITITFIN